MRIFSYIVSFFPHLFSEEVGKYSKNRAPPAENQSSFNFFCHSTPFFTEQTECFICAQRLHVLVNIAVFLHAFKNQSQFNLFSFSNPVFFPRIFLIGEPRFFSSVRIYISNFFISFLSKKITFNIIFMHLSQDFLFFYSLQYPSLFWTIMSPHFPKKLHHWISYIYLIDP